MDGKSIRFTLKSIISTPKSETDSFKDNIIVKAKYNDEYYERGIKEINYDHIIQQVRFPLSEIQKGLDTSFDKNGGAIKVQIQAD